MRRMDQRTKSAAFAILALALVTSLGVGRALSEEQDAKQADNEPSAEAAEPSAEATPASQTIVDLQKAVPEQITPTHKQVRIISLPSNEEPSALHTFCLDGGGRILAACGGARTSFVRTAGSPEIKTIEEPAEIRVISPEGKLLKAISLDFGPSAINVDDQGTIYVAGNGRVAKLNARGKVLAVVDAPQIAKLGPLPPMPEPKEESEESEEEKKALEAKIAEANAKYQKAIEVYQEARSAMTAAKDAEAKKDAEAGYQKALAELGTLSRELYAMRQTPEMIAMQARYSAMRKRAVTGIAVAGDDVFVAVPMVSSYGYAVWRMDADLDNPVRIVDGLRGCCGQMDIQAHGGVLYVAENSRGQVVGYDRDGREVAAFGRRDRKSIEGFGSCCNPMNIRFGPEGEIYTSEASLGRVKRFSTEGEFLGLVGTAEIIPGCKHVAIDVSKDGKQVYMLDITRSQVVVLAAQEKQEQ